MSEGPDLAAIRTAASARAAQLGRPHNRDEDWRYVALAGIDDYQPDTSRDMTPMAIRTAAAPLLAALADTAIVLHDGTIVAGDEHPRCDHDRAATWHRRWHDDRQRYDHTRAWALQRTPAPLHLSLRGTVSEPVVVINALTGDHGGSAMTIDAAPGSVADVVICHLHLGRAEHATAIDLHAGDGSTVRIDELELGADPAQPLGVHCSTRNLDIERDAQVAWAIAGTGGDLIRQAVHATLAGHGAYLELAGALVASGEDQGHQHLRVIHACERGTSRQHYKNVVGDRARASFDGLVVVAPGADGTDAEQHNANLELSPRATIATRPQLDIHTDDVKAGHGSTVGQPDHDEIYYLRTRGLDDAAARSLIIRGFAREAIERLANPTVRAAAEERLLGVL